MFPSEIDTTEVNLLYTIGREFHGIGLFQEASKYFERVVVKDERIYEPYPFLAQIYCSEQRYFEAIDLLSKFLNERPKRYERTYLAMIYNKVDSTDKAKEEFHKIIALSDTFYYGHPRRPNHNWKGHAFYMWGNYEEAEKEWKIYKQTHLHNVVAYHNLSTVYLTMGCCNELIKEYEEAKKRFPEDPIVHIDEGFMELGAENYNGALTKFKLALEKWSSSGVCNGYMAYTLEKLGRYEEAKQYWNLCILRVPGGVNLQKVQTFIEKMVNNVVECIQTSENK